MKFIYSTLIFRVLFSLILLFFTAFGSSKKVSERSIKESIFGKLKLPSIIREDSSKLSSNQKPDKRKDQSLTRDSPLNIGERIKTLPSKASQSSPLTSRDTFAAITHQSKTWNHDFPAESSRRSENKFLFQGPSGKARAGSKSKRSVTFNEPKPSSKSGRLVEEKPSEFSAEKLPGKLQNDILEPELEPPYFEHVKNSVKLQLEPLVPLNGLTPSSQYARIETKSDWGEKTALKFPTEKASERAQTNVLGSVSGPHLPSDYQKGSSSQYGPGQDIPEFQARKVPPKISPSINYEPGSSSVHFDEQNPSTQSGKKPNHAGSWEIIYTAFVVRHGIRESERIVTFTPKERRRWSQGLALLTQAGKDGTRRLGKAIKVRYSSLLENPDRTEIKAFSTACERTISTAKLLLEELYGPNRWKPDVIDYQRRWAKAGRMRYNWELSSVNENRFLDYERTLFEVIYKNVKRFIPHLKLPDLYAFSDTMLCEHANGVRLPQEILDLTENFYHYKYWKFSKQHSTLYLMQAKAAPYLSDIVNGMKKIVEGKRTAAKFEIFSTHDSYLQTIMKALDPLPPFDGYFKTDFASAIIFELYRSTNYYNQVNQSQWRNNFIVKIRYNYDASLLNVVPVSLYDCQHKSLPGDLNREREPFCFLDEFFTTLQKFTMDKYEYVELMSGKSCKSQRDYDRILSAYHQTFHYSRDHFF